MIAVRIYVHRASPASTSLYRWSGYRKWKIPKALQSEPPNRETAPDIACLWREVAIARVDPQWNINCLDPLSSPAGLVVAVVPVCAWRQIAVSESAGSFIQPLSPLSGSGPSNAAFDQIL
ncbi:hypothetical protein M8818_006059 [Zalaria obscura]|uniref:Uncharacterized protein n=1 Tax=Zalaria obscura TaxID=2024903 RepID=A0ACC3S8P1_9PEZI